MRRSVSRIAVALATAALVLIALAPIGSAADGVFEIVIPVTTVVHAGDGSITELANQVTPEEFVGHECVVIAKSENQGSVHSGNDLIIASGSDSVTAHDVEAEPLGTVEANGTLVLGLSIVISLDMGPDEVFSAGIDVKLDCTPPTPPTTEATISPTSITSPPTTAEVLPTSITSAPPTTEEIDAVDTLPFTGVESGTPALLALALIGIGALALVATRKAED